MVMFRGGEDLTMWEVMVLVENGGAGAKMKLAGYGWNSVLRLWLKSMKIDEN